MELKFFKKGRVTNRNVAKKLSVSIESNIADLNAVIFHIFNHYNLNKRFTIVFRWLYNQSGRKIYSRDKRRGLFHICSQQEREELIIFFFEKFERRKLVPKFDNKIQIFDPFDMKFVIIKGLKDNE